MRHHRLPVPDNLAPAELFPCDRTPDFPLRSGTKARAALGHLGFLGGAFRDLDMQSEGDK